MLNHYLYFIFFIFFKGQKKSPSKLSSNKESVLDVNESSDLTQHLQSLSDYITKNIPYAVDGKFSTDIHNSVSH